MKKDLESSPKLSSEHSIEETKKEQETVHNQSEVAINNDSLDASKQSTNQKYFRCSLFTIEPEKQKEFIEQSDSFKKRSQKKTWRRNFVCLHDPDRKGQDSISG